VPQNFELSTDPLERASNGVADAPPGNIIQFFRKVFASLAFLILSIPGIFCTYAFVYVGYLGLTFSPALNTLIDKMVSFEGSISGDITSLIVAAFPGLVLTTCFRANDQSTLTMTGVVCLLLSLAGALFNFTGFFLLAINYYASNLGTPEVVSALRSLCEKALYVTLLYSLMILRMRPLR
jgi:hypothetical protein